MVLKINKKNKIINQVIDILISSESNKENDNFKKFIHAFLKRGNIEDFLFIGIDELCKKILFCWKLAQIRKIGSHKITISSDDYNNYNAQSYIYIVNDDIPFLFDSILNKLNESNNKLKFILHPIIFVKRDIKECNIIKIIGDDEYNGELKNTIRESYIYIIIEKINKLQQKKLILEFENILLNIKYAVLDWKPMCNSIKEVIKVYHNNILKISSNQLHESIDFLYWLLNDNFIFLGIREYYFKNKEININSINISNIGLGILRNKKIKVLKRGGNNLTVISDVHSFIVHSQPIFIAKSNIKSVVHRCVYMDYIGLKLYDKYGNIFGELKVVGLFTSNVYASSSLTIPFLRYKIEHIIKCSGLKRGSHSYKALINILENYPRDELFQIDSNLLLKFVLAIQQLDERPVTSVFIRSDKFNHFISVLVYIIRDHYNSEVKQKISKYLVNIFNGYLSAVYPFFPEGPMTRVHFIIELNENTLLNYNSKIIEKNIDKIIRTWKNRLVDELNNNIYNLKPSILLSQYGNSFSAAYRENFTPKDALDDIMVMCNLCNKTKIDVKLVKKNIFNNQEISLKIYHLGKSIALSDRIPIIENMGFRAINERSYCVKCCYNKNNLQNIWIHDIVLISSVGANIDIKDKSELLREAFLAIWDKRAEDDGFNKLILMNGIKWRNVVMLRAYGRFLKQSNLSFSQCYIWNTLCKHGNITINFIELFYLKFGLNNPIDSFKSQQKIINKIILDLDNVSSIDEDRIIRAFLNVINSTIRTNFYQLDKYGLEKTIISLKIRSKEVEILPEPKPFAEIFVYSTRFEGIHLRGGKIARGGLRWSDRLEDFRTEVLGLVKAQHVKNAVIVPVGSKGCFVLKHLPINSTRDEFILKGITCYKEFIGSLLDITDNLDGEKIIDPKNVVKLDDDDPYLVVAADKGTATFSDIANDLAKNKNFWLGDAFASGGSVGYDHKKIGITARGCWEAVKRHFREINHNIQNKSFKVIGIGDMSGDVFGNGMLLSKHIKLVAAFDHRDIFIDPEPNVVTSFIERKRLFKKLSSSWIEYDKKIISKGGGIFNRALKSIPLSKEIKKITRLHGDCATPNEIIRALLCIDVDLLWFGGIGTYIRATNESNIDVGDQANDVIRITAADLKVKVLGEGANLGITHNARIEFAKLGGKVNTDAIDNSAGVNISDMEVNIKIALGCAIKSNKLNYEDRNKLLSSMMNEVKQLVLRNNYLQTLSLTLAIKRSQEDMCFYERLMMKLEKNGDLDRSLEFLPSSIEMIAREQNKEYLTRPELSVLLAYAKISLYELLLKSSVIDDIYFSKELLLYFPKTMRKDYIKEIEEHKLRREIIATRLSNLIINRGGPAFIISLINQYSVKPAIIATAFMVAYDSFEMIFLNNRIDQLDNKVNFNVQTNLYLKVQNLLYRQTVWFLHYLSKDNVDLAVVVNNYKIGIKYLMNSLSDHLPIKSLEFIKTQSDIFIKFGVPKDFANIMASTRFLHNASNIVCIAEQVKLSLKEIAKLYFYIGNFIGIQWLISSAYDMITDNYYDRLAVNHTIDILQISYRRIVFSVLAQNKNKNKALEIWKKKYKSKIDKVNVIITNIELTNELTLSKLIVVSTYIDKLIINNIKYY